MQHIFLTIIALMIFLSYGESAPELPLPGWAMLALVFCVLLLLQVVFGLYVTRRSTSAFLHFSDNPEAAVAKCSRMQGVQTFLTLFCYALLVHYWHWPGKLLEIPVFASWNSLFVSIGFVPFVLFFLLRWVLAIPLERVLQGSSWSISTYLRFKCFPLLPLFPVMLILLLEDLSRFLPVSLTQFFSNSIFASTALMAGTMILMVSAFPFLLRVLFRCKPLPQGATRTVFEAMIQKSGVGCRNIYLWPTGGLRIPNAMMTGVLPGFQFVFITDEILTSMSPSAVCGVFAHELGHGKHKHLLFLFTLIFIFMFLLLTVVTVCDALLGESWLSLVLIAACVLLYWGGLLPYCYRRFEREADLYAAQLTGSSRTIVEGLAHIQALVGKHKKIPSFTHFSIQERIEFLAASEQVPVLAKRFMRQMSGMKIGLLVLLVCSFVLYYPLGQADLEHTRFRSVVKEDRLPLKEYDFAEQRLKNAVQHNPYDLDSRLLLAEIYLMQADLAVDQAPQKRALYLQQAYQEFEFVVTYNAYPRAREHAKTKLVEINKLLR